MLTSFNNITNTDVSKDEIRKQIVELVQNSQNSFENEISENATFTFSTKGKIIVKKVDSSNKGVLVFIRENTNSKKLKNPGKAHKNFKMSILIQ